MKTFFSDGTDFRNWPQDPGEGIKILLCMWKCNSRRNRNFFSSKQSQSAEWNCVQFKLAVPCYQLVNGKTKLDRGKMAFELSWVVSGQRWCLPRRLVVHFAYQSLPSRLRFLSGRSCFSLSRDKRIACNALITTKENWKKARAHFISVLCLLRL